MVKGKLGLGKGLDSMIPERIDIVSSKNVLAKEDYNVSRETLISINEIEPNKEQPRKNFNEDSLHELAESIKQFGVIQPLLLQKRDKYYEIIAGERRWRAARIAGLNKVPAIIKEYSTQEMVEIALIENIQREDLNPIEEALAYQRLILEFHLKQDEVADRVSKSRTAITNSMRLLKLGTGVQQMLIDEIITSGHARTLIMIEDPEVQHSLALKILDENLSVRETEKMVKKVLENKEPKVRKVEELNYIYKDLEEKMRTIIGTKVTICKKEKNKGKIEIEYYSNEELERIFELMMTMTHS